MKQLAKMLLLSAQISERASGVPKHLLLKNVKFFIAKDPFCKNSTLIAFRKSILKTILVIMALQINCHVLAYLMLISSFRE